MTHLFFAGSLSYLLHHADAPVYSIKVLVVLRADDFGGRGCRNRAILEGSDSLVWRPTLCKVPSYAVVKLRRGGLVKVQGVFSSYGTQARYYALAERE